MNTPTTPTSLMALITTGSGQQVRIGRTDTDIPSGSLVAIAEAEDCRQWLVIVAESGDPADCIEQLVIDVPAGRDLHRSETNRMSGVPAIDTGAMNHV
tara:strand:- start:155656 stop:155949 length:294 start_codon:yes stop_codon:yes gene_type:complete